MYVQGGNLYMKDISFTPVKKPTDLRCAIPASHRERLGTYLPVCPLGAPTKRNGDWRSNSNRRKRRNDSAQAFRNDKFMWGYGAGLLRGMT